MTKVE